MKTKHAFLFFESRESSHHFLSSSLFVQNVSKCHTILERFLWSTSRVICDVCYGEEWPKKQQINAHRSLTYRAQSSYFRSQLSFFVLFCVSRRQIPKRDLAPKDTVDESNCGSFLQAVDWKAGTADGPGPKPLTDRWVTPTRKKTRLLLLNTVGVSSVLFFLRRLASGGLYLQ